MDLLISVVIPTYRRPEMLAELLGALLPQCAGQPVEVLVIDNCPEASARDSVADLALRYIHEPQAGVVHARNRGVAEAAAPYILFIDDDEVPAPGWLAAFLARARAGDVFAFGRILPRYPIPPTPELKRMLDRLFSRVFELPDGADLSDHHIGLGTGNALFDKARCFTASPPFDPAFNRSGGEDVWIITRAVASGAKPVWVEGGLVEEVVPEDRMTLAHLKARRFNQGRLRCVFLAKQKRWGKAVLWTLIGGVQAGLHGALALLGRLTGSTAWAFHAAQMQGGLGKLLWWQGERRSYYTG